MTALFIYLFLISTDIFINSYGHDNCVKIWYCDNPALNTVNLIYSGLWKPTVNGVCFSHENVTEINPKTANTFKNRAQCTVLTWRNFPYRLFSEKENACTVNWMDNGRKSPVPFLFFYRYFLTVWKKERHMGFIQHKEREIMTKLSLQHEISL